MHNFKKGSGEDIFNGFMTEHEDLPSTRVCASVEYETTAPFDTRACLSLFIPNGTERDFELMNDSRAGRWGNDQMDYGSQAALLQGPNSADIE